MASFNVYPEVEALLKPEIELPLLLPRSNASDASNALALLPLAIYPSRKALLRLFKTGLGYSDMPLLFRKVQNYRVGTKGFNMYVITAL
jgi:hypothetical protein